MLAALLIASALLAQQQEQIHVTAIEVVAEVRDKQGHVPRDLTPADFALLEDGVAQKIVGVEYLGGAAQQKQEDAPPRPWQIVIYFDAFFSAPDSIRRVADSLAAQADELARLGSVEIVVGDPAPTLVLAASSDPAKIREGLNAAAARGAVDWLVRHRRQYVHGNDLSEGEHYLRPFIDEELAAVTRFRGALLQWMSRYPRHVPRALFFVSGGFDIDPLRFYLSSAGTTAEAAKLTREFSRMSVGPMIDSIGRALAVTSWTVVAVEAPFGAGAQWLEDSGRSGIGRSGRRPGSAAFTSVMAREPLVALAEATGGSVVNRAKLADSVTRLGERVKITYQVSRPPDGRPRKIDVRAQRKGLTVQSVRWASEVTPEEVAAARAVRIARDGGPEGELPLTASLAWEPAKDGRRSGNIVVSAKLDAIAPILRERKGVFRVTIAALEKNAQPFVIHRVVSDYDVSAGTFLYRAPIAADQQITVAIVVEELSTGTWGGDVGRDKAK